jgi:acylaminoacyl-peptidase
MKSLTRFALVFLLAGGLAFGQGRALKIEDYYKIKTVGDVQISPNGKWVTFTVSTKVEDDNTTAIETYVVPADGSSQPRKIQHEGKDTANPRWTDDGLLQYSLRSRVPSAIFLGSVGMSETAEPVQQRGGQAAQGQLYKVAVDTANAAPSLAQPGPPGVTSADGKSVAQAKDKPRTAATPTYDSDFEKRHMDRFKGKTFDWMRFQQDGQEFPTPDPRLRPVAEITITPAGGSQAKELTSLGFRPANLAWNPAGTMIAFTADENWKEEQKYESPDIYTVTIDGKVTRMTNDGYVWSSLAYSPDGKFLLSERTFGTDMIIKQKLNHGGSDDLILWPTGGGTQIDLTEKWDLEPNGPRWSPDSKYIYFTAEKGGTTHLFRVAPRAGAPVEQVTQGERRVGSVTFDKAMTKIAYTVGTYEAPSDVWTANIDGSGEKKISNVHADVLREIGFTKTERLKWKSYDGTEIEGFLSYRY